LGQAGAVGTIRYTSSNIDFWPKIAQIVTQNLQDVGLAVQTQYVDSATDTALQFDPKGHDLFQTCRGGALADPESWLAFQESASGYWSSAFGVTGILPDASAKIDQLILAASQQTNVKKRQALYHQLQLLIFDRIAPYAILGYHSHGIVRSSKIHNLNANALNAWALYAQRVWVG
jgi:ABC-type transport system substrate-binding protein